MKSKLVPALAAIACSWVTVLGSAGAATIAPQSGEVLVNQGNGFVAVPSSAEVGPGGQLLVRPGGTALIRYANGCSVRVDSGRIWVIQDKPPCEPDRSIDLTSRMNGGSLKDGPEEVREDDRRWLLVPLAVGVGVGVCFLTFCNGDDDKHKPVPVSP